MQKLTFGSLFAGIGGFDLGFERVGMVCQWQVEIDDFCNKVLAKHWPDVARYRDVRQCGKQNLQTVDVICGGFPCQPHSTSGKRKGSKDDRDLWREYARIISEIKPRWVVAENVSGLFTSDDGRYFGELLRGLAEIGYDAEWHCITASSVGLPHKRKRIFLLAYPVRHDAQEGATFGNETISIPKAGASSKYRGLFTTPWYELIPSNTDLRRSNGVPDRVDRLKSLGNAVVPQVAELIGRLIVETELEFA